MPKREKREKREARSEKREARSEKREARESQEERRKRKDIEDIGRYREIKKSVKNKEERKSLEAIPGKPRTIPPDGRRKRTGKGAAQRKLSAECVSRRGETSRLLSFRA
jgi:hypothetical protein